MTCMHDNECRDRISIKFTKVKMMEGTDEY